MTQPLLELGDLTAAYGPVQVLFGLDLVVNPGEFVVMLGANGAGKTTTLRAISGLVSASGTMNFDGASILGDRADKVAKVGIAHVPQGRGTLSELTVEENLAVGAYLRSDGEVDDDVARWFDTFPRLAERRHQTAGSMSGGEQQMLAIARAMMGRPRLILLDEPSLGLAPLITREVFERLSAINESEGLAVLLVEQNANLALEVADRAYVLEAGKITDEGTAAELLASESVQRAYLGV
ncbi:MAG: ABC transporter ATP-binding protein [Microthrixaceae bacterium]|nr:ABC transporter ATP-binding protein [Microthrixaceae bacterium]